MPLLVGCDNSKCKAIFKESQTTRYVEITCKGEGFEKKRLYCTRCYQLFIKGGLVALDSGKEDKRVSRGRADILQVSHQSPA